MYSKCAFYIGLIFECPYKNEREDCPFLEMRKIEIEQRIENYLEMDIDELKAMLNMHINCENKNNF
jgi:hypothetical protein